MTRLIPIAQPEIDTFVKLLDAAEFTGKKKRHLSIMGIEIIAFEDEDQRFSFHRTDGAWKLQEVAGHNVLVDGFVKMGFDGDEDTFRNDLTMIRFRL